MVPLITSLHNGYSRSPLRDSARRIRRMRRAGKLRYLSSANNPARLPRLHSPAPKKMKGCATSAGFCQRLLPLSVQNCTLLGERERGLSRLVLQWPRIGAGVSFFDWIVPTHRMRCCSALYVEVMWPACSTFRLDRRTRANVNVERLILRYLWRPSLG